MWYVVGALGIIVLWAIIAYNGLISRRNRVSESWSGIDVQLKRRRDLIPNLVETVKGYAQHEKTTLDAVIQARNQAMAASGPEEAAAAENMVTGTLRQLFALGEAYPDLKANQNFLSLQSDLADTEDKIQAARRIYNANVRDFNTRLQTIPTNIIGNIAGFSESPFFEIEDPADREVVNVSFS